MEPERDFGRVRKHLAQEPNTVVADDVELRRVLEGEATGGWVSGDAFIVYRRGIGNVYLGHGTPEEIGALLAHHLRWLDTQPEWKGDLAVQCAAAPSALMQACQRYYAGLSMGPSGMFRVGPLKPLLGKACRAAQWRSRHQRSGRRMTAAA